jgi:hypothetical protein
MTWRTIMVCGECYGIRRDTDDQLIDRPSRWLGDPEICHDCGSPGADIPIRANVNPQSERN